MSKLFIFIRIDRETVTGTSRHKMCRANSKLEVVQHLIDTQSEVLEGIVEVPKSTSGYVVTHYHRLFCNSEECPCHGIAECRKCRRLNVNAPKKRITLSDGFVLLSRSYREGYFCACETPDFAIPSHAQLYMDQVDFGNDEDTSWDFSDPFFIKFFEIKSEDVIAVGG